MATLRNCEWVNDDLDGDLLAGPKWCGWSGTTAEVEEGHWMCPECETVRFIEDDEDEDEAPSEYDRLTNDLADLTVEEAEEKANHLERCIGLEGEAMARERAHYARFRAGAASLRRDLLAKRDRAAKEAQASLGNPARLGLRVPVFKMAEAILAYEAALDNDDQDLADETEDKMFAVLDTAQLYARGRVWTVREFMTEGRAKW